MSEYVISGLTDGLLDELAAHEAARYRFRKGDTVDGLQIEGGLGVGTFGEVYAVYDPALGSNYALKILRRREVWAREAFRREIRLLAGFRHPNIVRIMRGGLWQDIPYFVMEKLDSLPEAPDGRAVLDWTVALCGALSEMNRAGVTHGDVKFGNVLWNAASRQPILADLGSAAPLRGTASDRGDPAADVYALALLARRLLPHRELRPGSPWRVALTEALVTDRALRIPTPADFARRLCSLFATSRRSHRRMPARRCPWD